MNLDERRRLVIVCACTLLAAAVLLLDLSTPLGIATGTLYVLVLACAAWTRRTRWTIAAAGLCTALTLAGWALSHGDPLAPRVIANRVIALAIVWFVAGLVMMRQRAEGRFRLAVQASPNGMILTDRRGTILMANAEAHRMFGYAQDELVGASIDLLVPEHVRPRHPELRERYMAAPRFLMFGIGRELYGRRKDGSEFPVEIGLNPVRSEEGVFVLSAVLDVSQRQEAQLHRDRLAAIVESSSDAIFANDLDGIVLEWNRGAERIYGWSREEMIGAHIERMFPASRAGELESILARIRQGEAVQELGSEHLTKDGRRIQVALSMTPLHDSFGRVVGASTIARDVTVERQAEARVVEMTLALAHAMPGIGRVDAQGNFESANEALAGFFGRPAEDLQGRWWMDAVPPEQRPAADAAFQEMLRDGQAELEIRIASEDGERYLFLFLVRRMDEEVRFAGFHCFSRDVTERRRSERRYRELALELEHANRELQRLAHVDPLTDLMNRRGLEVVLGSELARARREGSTLVAILVDVDAFKRINDEHGHLAGDRVLSEVARRIRQAARDMDHVARIGGDEFLVVLPATRAAQGAAVAERIRVAVSGEPAHISSEVTLPISASVGVQEIPDSHLSIAGILALTQGELQVAKRTGKNRVAGRASGLPGALAELLEGRGLRTVYQSIRDLREDRVIGHEILTRGPAGPLEAPAELLKAARAHGILAGVDLSCLRACLRSARYLPAEERIHVNLFPETLLERPLEEILEVLAEAPPGRRICIELNEHQFVGDPSRLRARLERLREHGIQIAIDDVGFGRSSLESLILLEPDLVKIDRRYVHGASRDLGRNRSLDRLANVASALRTQAIAEGIEEEQDLSCLRALGLRYGQGFLWGEPRELGSAEPQSSAGGSPWSR